MRKWKLRLVRRDQVDKWDGRFLRLAKHIAEWSKDPSTQVGAVIVRPDRTIASMGYNGFPIEMNDDIDRYLDRESKYRRIIHAEMNAILFMREKAAGYTLYTWPMLPCERCAVYVIQAGFKRVVAPVTHIERWTTSVEIAKDMFREGGVIVCEVPRGA